MDILMYELLDFEQEIDPTGITLYVDHGKQGEIKVNRHSWVYNSDEDLRTTYYIPFIYKEHLVSIGTGWWR